MDIPGDESIFSGHELPPKAESRVVPHEDKQAFPLQNEMDKTPKCEPGDALDAHISETVAVEKQSPKVVPGDSPVEVAGKNQDSDPNPLEGGSGDVPLTGLDGGAVITQDGTYLRPYDAAIEDSGFREGFYLVDRGEVEHG